MSEYTEQKVKDARSLLALKVREIDAQVSECETLADKYNLSFRMEPCYGAGATYDGEEAEWFASSEQC